jgi:4-alpha-glucanotransferase
LPLQRASGLLLHPTSLPGGHGIGDLGQGARDFLEFLSAGRQQYWQVLPLGPTGYGDSPYQAFSAFAGNPLLIDLAALVTAGYLQESDLENAPLQAPQVDFGWVVQFKQQALNQAYSRFKELTKMFKCSDFEAFKQVQSAWLDDYALFTALKEHHGGASWNTWESALRLREASALEAKRQELGDRLEFTKFAQWIFFSQWNALKFQANERGIRIIGDVPIFVSLDSADAWARPELFQFDSEGHPTVVAGVPPDYFSPTGQLWGNPLYNWAAMATSGYAWWILRMQQAFKLYDLVRLDHFRGFQAYWEVPAGEKTAINGRWVKGPGAALFEALESALGELPIIAEDLGLITPEVEKLRDDFALPGMKILQFAFSDPANAYLPHHFVPQCVAYTGTHDNDTSRGWFDSAPEENKAFALKYLQTDEAGFTWALIRLGMASVAALTLVPIQDLLDLGSEARMNMPSTAAGNWSWRLNEGQLNEHQANMLADWAWLYGRTPEGVTTQLPHGAEAIVVHDN